MPDIFDEVEEDLRAERARAFGRQFAGAGIGLLVLILVGTGGYVYWQQTRAAAANAVANRFITAAGQADHAMSTTGADPSQAAPAAATLAAIAQSGPAGYRVLASLRLAALQWQTGQHDQADATWRKVADDSAAPQLLRDLATLTGAQHQIDSGDPVQLKQRLETLTAPGNPWRPMAEQLVALLDIRTGQVREAAGIMQRLTLDGAAPDDMRQMATDLLSTLPPDALAPAVAPSSAAKPANVQPGSPHPGSQQPGAPKPAPAPPAHAAAAHG